MRAWEVCGRLSSASIDGTLCYVTVMVVCVWGVEGGGVLRRTLHCGQRWVCTGVLGHHGVL